MKNLLPFLLGLLFWTTATAQFTIKQVLNSPFPTELTAAPTEEKVAWVFNQEGVRNIWLAEGAN